MKYYITAVDEYGGLCHDCVSAKSEKQAEDIFYFRHAAEELEIIKIIGY